MTIMPTYITIGELTRRGLSSPLRPTGEPGIWHHHIPGTDITETVYDPRWRLVGDLPKQLVQVASRRAALGQTQETLMTFHRNQYLQSAANRCKGFADEGACLARISRVAPVTIVPGFGLGQATLGTTTLAPRSSQLIAVQQALISAGLLALRAPDGVISATSPTLSALQQWATNNGYSASGAARTSSGGLVIPNELFAAILTQRTAPRSGSTPSSPPTSVPSGGGYVKDTSASPSPATTMPVSTLPGWLPWAIGISVTALGVGALVRFSR